MSIYIDTEEYDIYHSIEDIRIASSLFEVDEFIAPIISILNKKGYYTRYCCSGHYIDDEMGDYGCSNNDCYIMFVNNGDMKYMKSLPEGFVLEEDNNYFDSFVIRKQYKNNDMNRYVEIMDTMKELYEWALKIPKREENFLKELNKRVDIKNGKYEFHAGC